MAYDVHSLLFVLFLFVLDDNKLFIFCLYLLDDCVIAALQEAIDDVNKGVKGFVNRHRSLRVLSFLATPWYLPVDISYTFAVR